jgi:hypothetical protein
MIEKETIFTVVGVILVGISYGLSSHFILHDISTSDELFERIKGSYLPLGVNIATLIYIVFGLMDTSKISNAVRVLIIVGFSILLFIEIDMIYRKPESSAGKWGGFTVVTASSLLRLYFIISMNCDFAKSIFVIAAKSIVEPTKMIAEVEPSAPNWDRAYNTFEQALKKIPDLSADERLEQINKFRVAWGKAPKDVSLRGGKR